LTLRRTGNEVDYQASANAATPGYFDALGLRLQKGRLFTADDDAAHPAVFIMSLDMAKRFFGEADPIGRTMDVPGLRDGAKTSAKMTLVGVVSNVKYSGLEGAADDSVYRPFAQQTWVAPFLVARTQTDPELLAGTLQRQIASIDRDIVVSDVKTMEAILADATASPRFRTVLLVGIAGLAVAISTVGLYGVTTQAVSRRTREIGIRMALGAHLGDIQRMVVREGLHVSFMGIGCGLAGAFALSRVLTGLLYGITATDAMSYGLSSLGLLLVAVVASYLPARRAARVNPIAVLRTE
jgi:putative ABC transport system permease protein